MALLSRKPDLPAERQDAWRAFLDCAGLLEGGRRQLLATLPTGRVEPAPVAVGLDAMARALADSRAWMPRWRVAELEQDWLACQAAIEEATTALAGVDEVAASTDELEELLTAVGEVVEPLDRFADAEREWRRQWRMPRDRP